MGTVAEQSSGLQRGGGRKLCLVAAAAPLSPLPQEGALCPAQCYTSMCFLQLSSLLSEIVKELPNTLEFQQFQQKSVMAGWNVSKPDCMLLE